MGKWFYRYLETSDDNEKNPSVAELYTPLVTSHMVTDEVERPSVVKMGGLSITSSLLHVSTNLRMLKVL